MGITDTEHVSKCPGYCKQGNCDGFQKIVELEDPGVTIYCHVDRSEEGSQDEKPATTTSQCTFILLNTKNVDITSEDLMSQLDINTIPCPRCKQILEHARKLLDKIPVIDKKNVVGVCDHCRLKAQEPEPCVKCKDTVNKFLTSRGVQKEDTKKYIKLWLNKIGHVLSNVISKDTSKIKRRSYSEIDIDIMKIQSSRSFREIRTQQMFRSEAKLLDTVLSEKKKQTRTLKKPVNFKEYNEVLDIPVTRSYSSITLSFRDTELHKTQMQAGRTIDDDYTTKKYVDHSTDEEKNISRKAAENMRDKEDLNRYLNDEENTIFQKLAKYATEKKVPEDSYITEKEKNVLHKVTKHKYVKEQLEDRYSPEPEKNILHKIIKSAYDGEQPNLTEKERNIVRKATKYSLDKEEHLTEKDKIVLPKSLKYLHDNEQPGVLQITEEEKNTLRKASKFTQDKEQSGYRHFTEEDKTNLYKSSKYSHDKEQPRDHYLNEKEKNIVQEIAKSTYDGKQPRVSELTEEEKSILRKATNYRQDMKQPERHHLIEEDKTILRKSTKYTHDKGFLGDRYLIEKEKSVKSKEMKYINIKDEPGVSYLPKEKRDILLKGTELADKEPQEDHYLTKDEKNILRKVTKYTQDDDDQGEHFLTEDKKKMLRRGAEYLLDKEQQGDSYLTGKEKTILHKVIVKSHDKDQPRDRYLTDEEKGILRKLTKYSHEEDHYATEEGKKKELKGKKYLHGKEQPRDRQLIEEKEHILREDTTFSHDKEQSEDRISTAVKNKLPSERAREEDFVRKVIEREATDYLSDDEQKILRKIYIRYTKEQKPIKKPKEEVMSEYKNLIQSKAKEISYDNLQKEMSFFFPNTSPVEVRKPKPRVVSSSELIENTRENLRLKAEEDKKKLEEERKKQLEEEEKRKLAREERKKQKEAIKAEKELKEKEEKQRRLEEEKEAKKRLLEEEKEEKQKRLEEEKEAKKRRLEEEKEEKQKRLEEEKEAKKRRLKEDKDAKAREVGEKRKFTKEPKTSAQELKPQTDKEKTNVKPKLKEIAEKSKKDIEEEKQQKKLQPLEEKEQSRKQQLDEKEEKKRQLLQEKEEKNTKRQQEEKMQDNSNKLAPNKKDNLAAIDSKKATPEAPVADSSKKDTDLEAFKQSQAEHDKNKEEARKRRQLEMQEQLLKGATHSKSLQVTAKVKPEPKKPEEKKEADVPMNKVKLRKPSIDDLILKLIQIKQADGSHKLRPPIDPKLMKIHKNHMSFKNAMCFICNDSDLQIACELYENALETEKGDNDIIIGEKIVKLKLPFPPVDVEQHEVIPMVFHVENLEESPPLATPKEVKKQAEVDPDTTKGIIRYALSDRTFIEKGWTMLPTEKVVRKMNVYRMRPAHPEFDWFEHNKNKRLMNYDTGEKLAEFDDNGRGRWYYRNGRLALDYYDAEETNAQQRFVVYSSGEPDERGRSHPITILATFDYLGNGIVFDHAGKIRLKYNQTEGVVLDRGIGPVSHWKWHTLNDPPVLQQVMIDTQMSHKDPDILKLGGPGDHKARPDNEEMLAIEFDNFIKEKSKKLSQKFKPFQIKMKALKINEHFSLRVLDQATIYLIYRDGSTNLKLNIGMILDHQEIVDTDTAEVGEVSNNLERLPARTDSLAGLQRSVAYAQRFERMRTERERRLRPPEPCGSADQLVAAASRPLRTPLRTVPSRSTSCSRVCRCTRKPSSNVYYNTRLP